MTQHTQKLLAKIIYPRISERIKKERKKEGKKLFQVSCNSSLLSAVIHGKRDKHKNPYLLTASIVQDIHNNLNFSSEYAVIWGEENERKEYFFEIFKDFITSIFKTDSKEIENLLFNDFEYAKARINLDNLKENYNRNNDPIFAEFELLDDEKNKLDNLEKEYLKKRKAAIKRLWEINKKSFLTEHEEFFTNEYATHINKKLEKFYKQYLPKLVANTHKYDNNLGTAIFTLMKDTSTRKKDNDILQGDHYLFSSDYNSKDTIEAHQKYLDENETIINLTERYINGLTLLQNTNTQIQL